MKRSSCVTSPRENEEWKKRRNESTGWESENFPRNRISDIKWTKPKKRNVENQSQLGEMFDQNWEVENLKSHFVQPHHGKVKNEEHISNENLKTFQGMANKNWNTKRKTYWKPKPIGENPASNSRLHEERPLCNFIKEKGRMKNRNTENRIQFEKDNDCTFELTNSFSNKKTYRVPTQNIRCNSSTICF